MPLADLLAHPDNGPILLQCFSEKGRLLPSYNCNLLAPGSPVFLYKTVPSCRHTPNLLHLLPPGLLIADDSLLFLTYLQASVAAQSHPIESRPSVGHSLWPVPT